MCLIDSHTSGDRYLALLMKSNILCLPNVRVSNSTEPLAQAIEDSEAVAVACQNERNSRTKKSQKLSGENLTFENGKPSRTRNALCL